MSISYIEQGDIFLTRAGAIALGVSAGGGYEVSPVFTTLLDRDPAAVASYRKQARAGRIAPGEYWVWRQTQPWLVLLAVQQAAVSPVRPRYLEAAVQRLARDWQREGLTTLALARPGAGDEWAALRPVLDHWLDATALPVALYLEHVAGVHAAEPWDSSSDE